MKGMRKETVSLPTELKCPETGNIIDDSDQISGILLESMLSPALHAPPPLSPIDETQIKTAMERNLGEDIDSEITKDELIDVIRRSRRGAPGPDTIHSDMIKNLSAKNLTSLLILYRRLLAAGTVPQDWKLALLIPLPKPGTCRNKADGYRPIALTSTLSKLLERIITRRISWHLEKENRLLPGQVGFRPNKSTTDAILMLDHYVKNSWRESNAAYGIFLDLKKAFDSVPPSKILQELAKCGIHGNLLKWLGNFLTDRSFV